MTPAPAIDHDSSNARARALTVTDRLDPRTLVEPPWVPPIERIAPRVARLLSRRPLRFGEATARLGAYVYGNLIVLAALLTLRPADIVSWHGAVTVLAAGVSTFLAHTFAGVLAHRVGHGHRSIMHAGLHAARTSLPIATSAIMPIAILAAGASLNWSDGVTSLSADLFVCLRIGLIGATAERFRGQRSSRRFLLVGVGIALASALIAIAKVLIAGS